MSRWGLLGAALIVTGAVAGAVGLLLVGTLLLLSSWLRTIWSRYGLSRVTYERSLVRDRALMGEEVELRISVWNAKILPLAWLEAEELVTDGTLVRERLVSHSDRPGSSMFHNTWTLRPFERVTTHLHVLADHRGVYRFGPVRLQVADLFGRDVAVESLPAPETLLVRPRSLPVHLRSPMLAPLGEQRARYGLHHDPALFAGVRPFQPGDPRRAVHWRATARLGQPVSKRFEPATLRQTLIALDVQTNEEPYWMMVYDDDLLESLVVAAASLGRLILDEGGGCGLAANAWSGSLARNAFLPPRAGQAQLPALLDLLARLSSFASTPFDVLLNDLPGRLTRGVNVVVLSCRDPRPIVALERRLEASGFPVTHVATGPRAADWADSTRAAGIEARVASLKSGWRDSRALDLAG